MPNSARLPPLMSLHSVAKAQSREFVGRYLSRPVFWATLDAMTSEATPQNAWVDSYLNALLTYGLSSEYTTTTKEQKFQDADRSAYSRFYVNSLLKLDEEALSSAYFKAASTKQGSDKDARMQYLSWRIWFLKRRPAIVRRSHRDTSYLQEEDSTTAGTASPGYSSDEDANPRQLSSFHDQKGSRLSQSSNRVASEVDTKALETGVKPKNLKVKIAHPEVLLERTLEELTLASTDATPLASAAPEPTRFDRLYVVMISLHGLVRGERMELGKDSDTGGQVKYVVELAKAMALHPAVHRVDLLTRLIRDPKVDKEYGIEEECLAKGIGETGGAYICRLPCGPVEQYISKERLWPHVREFADRGIQHVHRTLAAMADDGHRGELYVVHGHYADAGEVAVLMSAALDSHMVMTGHSLGRNKLEHLLKGGSMTRAEIEDTYAIGRRIEAEERALDNALMVFTSTQQEVDEQWGLYDGYSSSLARVLHFRRTFGRHMPFMKVSPPGLDFSNLKVNIPEDPVIKEFEQQRAAFATLQSGGGSNASDNLIEPQEASKVEKQPETPHRQEILDPTVALIPEGPRIWQDIARFLRNPLKPAVLAMSRPDAKKNITTLVKAFGENPMLRELSNLVLIMGNRDDIDSMAGGSQKVLIEVLKLIDLYDLHGSVAYPKHHSQSEISDIYTFATATRGVFTNIALQEPFGLTVIEAAAHGAPTVATSNGGPVDIMATLHHGVTVEPTDSKLVATALLNILTNPTLWSEMSENGVKNIMAYSWPSHCKRYVAAVDAECRSIRSVKGHDRSMSGLLDARIIPGDARIASSSNEVEQTLTVDIGRQYSMPPASVQPKLGPLSPQKNLSGISSDDLAILQSLGDTFNQGTTTASSQRKSIVLVAIDSSETSSTSVELIRKIQASIKEEAVGFGLLSMLGFDSTGDALRAGGVDPDSIDFMVCNAGADVWQRSVKGTWDADEQYQGIIEFAWDRTALHRTLKKIISQPNQDHTSLPRLKELLYNVVEAPQQGIHPRHICIELDPETQAILAAGMGPRAKHSSIELSRLVTERLRRRLRRKGFRASYTLQMVPKDDDFMSVLHITPVRASRSLALRLIARNLGCTLENVLLVIPTFASEGTKLPDLKIAGHTNDLADLVSGVQRVLFVSHASESGSLNGKLLSTCGVDLKPWTYYGDRVILAPSEDVERTVGAHVARAK